ncbi:MAG: FAD-dependent oxidoreductase [Deinococcota bacterium]
MRHPKQVVVIGAGIVGASCAYYLAQAGASVTILEAKPEPALGATSRSAGGLRHQFSEAQNIKMSLYSAEQYNHFEVLTGVSAGYRKVGYLFLLPPDMWDDWQVQLELQRSLGAKVEALSIDMLQERFPNVNPEGLAGATLGLHDGVIDPPAITKGYLAAAQDLRVTLRYDSPVERIERKRNTWRIKAGKSLASADVIVNAAGAHAQNVAALVGLYLPVLPYRRNIYVTKDLPDYPHPSPLTIDMATGIWLRSEDTHFLMGRSNLNEPPGDNQEVDWDWLQQSLTPALHRFPALGRVNLDLGACWAGLYAITPDHTPILGEAVSHPGFINACGFSGHGVQHAPATGLIIKEVIFEETPTFELERYRLERFNSKQQASETNIV